MKIIKLFTILLSFVFLYSCGSSDNSSKTPKIPIEGTKWSLYQMDGAAFKSEKTITIYFNSSEKKVSGIAPCNNYFGTYTKDGSNLTFSPLASTKKACPELETETKYMSLVQSCATYKISGTELNLYDASGKVVLIFTSK